MKGGIAALVAALEGLAGAGVKLAGDVVFCTVTDEGPRAPAAGRRYGTA